MLSCEWVRPGRTDAFPLLRPASASATQILLALGISSLTENLERAIALICLGSLCARRHYPPVRPQRGVLTRSPHSPAVLPAVFIPGSYASYILYGAFREWHGFAYDQVPSYDD